MDPVYVVVSMCPDDMIQFILTMDGTFQSATLTIPGGSAILVFSNEPFVYERIKAMETNLHARGFADTFDSFLEGLHPSSIGASHPLPPPSVRYTIVVDVNPFETAVSRERGFLWVTRFKNGGYNALRDKIEPYAAQHDILVAHLAEDPTARIMYCKLSDNGNCTFKGFLRYIKTCDDAAAAAAPPECLR